jgi:hypothetical protein
MLGFKELKEDAHLIFLLFVEHPLRKSFWSAPLADREFDTRIVACSKRPFYNPGMKVEEVQE